MLWRAIKTRDNVVAHSGQGMYWQGSDKTHRLGLHLEQSKSLQDSEKGETDYSHGVLRLNSD